MFLFFNRKQHLTLSPVDQCRGSSNPPDTASQAAGNVGASPTAGYLRCGERKDSGFEMRPKKDKFCRDIGAAWAAGTMNIIHSLDYAMRFHIQVFYMALITSSTPRLNQAKGNQAKPYSTFPRGKTLSFAFVLLRPF